MTEIIILNRFQAQLKQKNFAKILLDVTIANRLNCKSHFKVEREICVERKLVL